MDNATGTVDVFDVLPHGADDHEVTLIALVFCFALDHRERILSVEMAFLFCVL
jgi:hypothetical protein